MNVLSSAPPRRAPWRVHLFYFFLCLCLPVRGDQSVKAFNAEPVGEITSHGDGDEVYEGYTESFRALVSDPDHAQDSLTVTWYAAGELACEAAAAESDGLSTCDVLIDSDTIEVSLEVVDPGGAAGSARVDLTVVPTESPEAEITSPTQMGCITATSWSPLKGWSAMGKMRRQICW